MSSQDTSAETEARYDRDVTLIIAATIGSTIVAVVIVVCLGCMYYFRCIRYKHLIKPEDKTGTQPSNTNSYQTVDRHKQQREARFEIEHEGGDGEKQVFKATAKLPKIKSHQAKVKLTLPITDKGVREYDGRISVDRFSSNVVGQHLFDMPRPPAQVSNLYDDKAMVQYERQVAILYDHIKEDYEHYFETKRNLPGMFARRWRIRTLFRQKSRERPISSVTNDKTADTTSPLNYFGSTTHVVSDPDTDSDNEPNKLKTPKDVLEAEKSSRENTNVKSVFGSFAHRADQMQGKMRETNRTKESKRMTRKKARAIKIMTRNMHMKEHQEKKRNNKMKEKSKFKVNSNIEEVATESHHRDITSMNLETNSLCSHNSSFKTTAQISKTNNDIAKLPDENTEQTVDLDGGWEADNMAKRKIGGKRNQSLRPGSSCSGFVTLNGISFEQ